MRYLIVKDVIGKYIFIPVGVRDCSGFVCAYLK